MDLGRVAEKALALGQRLPAESYEERRQWLNEFKLERGCDDCGYAGHPAALDFDHRPGETKLFSLAQGCTRSWDVMLAEIAKCDVVCANCHRIRHAGER
jgi:hypothetical protein